MISGQQDLPYWEGCGGQSDKGGREEECPRQKGETVK